MERSPLKRLTALAATAAAIVALAGCDSEDKQDAAPKPKPSTSAPAQQADTGIPPEPTGTKRAAYLAAIKAIDPALVTDADKAIDAGRNQCSSLNGGAQNVNNSAAQRFGNDAHPLTDEQGKALNAALRKTLCPDKG